MANGEISRDELSPMSKVQNPKFDKIVQSSNVKKSDDLGLWTLNSGLYFETHGAGEPLILIPGFASGAWSWFCQIQDLSKDFQVITFDPRGIGQSKVDENDLRQLSMQTYVEDVLQILDELKIAKAHVLGASFGGFVAQEFALKHPERVDKLILACTTAGGANHIAPDIEILRSFTRNPNFSVGEQIRHFFRPAFTEKFNVQHAAIVEKVCCLREKNVVTDAVYAAQLQTAFTFNLADEISAIKHETLVLTGDKDNLVPMPNSINLAGKIPNSTLKIIENGSHMIFVENADEFNRTVKEFCQNRLR
jgi:3-oxoadipate enol-lactonase